MRLLPALAAAAALAALPATAHAAAPWSAPQTLQDGLTDATPTGAVITRAGTPMTAWSFSSAARGSGGTLAAGPRLEDVGTQLAEGPVAYASDHGALMTVRYGRVVGGYVQQTLYLRTVDGASGAISKSSALVRDAQIGATALAGGPDGRVAAAWIQRRDGRDLVAYAVRSGGKLSAPHVVSGSGFAEDVALAYDDAGDLLIAYARNHGGKRLIVRIQRAGHSLGAERDTGYAAGLVDIAAAGGADGRFALAWRNEDASGAGPGFPPTVTATQGTATGGLQVARQLAAGGSNENARGRVVAGFGGDGVATVAFSLPEGGAGDQIHAAVARPGAGFVTSNLKLPGAVTDIAEEHTGASIFAATDAGPIAIRRILGFEAPQAIDATAPAGDVRAAVDPRTGRARVVWSAGAPGAVQIRTATR